MNNVNAQIMLQFEEYKETEQKQIEDELEKVWSLGKMKVYQKSISLSQTIKQKRGEFFENVIAKLLDQNDIRYKRQVVIDSNGILVERKEKRVHHIVDFLIGDCIEYGQSISDFKVVSCKTTCRERWTQDNWSFVFRPKLFLLVTVSDDYPPSERFKESDTRKIVTLKPKKKDTRISKLNFDALVDLLR